MQTYPPIQPNQTFPTKLIPNKLSKQIKEGHPLIIEFEEVGTVRLIQNTDVFGDVPRDTLFGLDCVVDGEGFPVGLGFLFDGGLAVDVLLELE